MKVVHFKFGITARAILIFIVHITQYSQATGQLQVMYSGTFVFLPNVHLLFSPALSLSFII